MLQSPVAGRRHPRGPLCRRCWQGYPLPPACFPLVLTSFITSHCCLRPSPDVRDGPASTIGRSSAPTAVRHSRSGVEPKPCWALTLENDMIAAPASRHVAHGVSGRIELQGRDARASTTLSPAPSPLRPRNHCPPLRIRAMALAQRQGAGTPVRSGCGPSRHPLTQGISLCSTSTPCRRTGATPDAAAPGSLLRFKPAQANDT